MSYSYEAAFADWLACAAAGVDEPAADIARAAGDDRHADVLVAGAAGHVLDFDDTYPPGLAHLSAPTAPAALLVGVDRGATIGEVVAAYEQGFEAMGAIAGSSHPALYERGWHPTAVCGAIGAAATVAALLELPEQKRVMAQRLAMLSAGGLRSSFGSHGKALQVGAAAAAGVRAARLARLGARAPAAVTAGFEAAYGATLTSDTEPAIGQNWIKAYPCCLQTHSAIEAAAELRSRGADASGEVTAVVHPRSVQAAPYRDVDTGLQAKFSIPYTVASTLLHGPPVPVTFASVDDDARELAGRVTVVTDEGLAESEAIVRWRGGAGELDARIGHARGSAQHPLSADERRDKIRLLGGTRLLGALDDQATPAAEVAAAAGLRP